MRIVMLLMTVGIPLSAAQIETTTTGQGLMCEKTVSERVPKIAKKTVSVMVRGTKKCGFLWLQTCSTYRLDVRTITHLQYTTKEHKVKECCNGTDANGNCNSVETPCLTPGRYGPDCALDCDCHPNNTLPEVCHKVNGACFCKDGYTGPRCGQAVNQTDEDEYSVFNNETEVVPLETVTTDTIAGGGDILSRVVVIVIALVGIFIIVLIVFCYRRRKRNKAVAGGSTSVSDDFVVSLHPAQEPPLYCTPEEVRKRKKEQEAAKAPESLTEKPYDYVEMRSVRRGRPNPGEGSEHQEVASVASSQAHKALEQEVDAGRQSIAYANVPSSGSIKPDPDTSHYYLEDDELKPPVSPTYSLMRRQESGDSAFGDDGYCTSPTSPGDDFNLHYSMPRYYKQKTNDKDCNRESNIYESPEPKEIRTEDSRKENVINNPEYANVSDSIEQLPAGVYSHLTTSNTPQDANDGYDHITKNVSVV